MGSADVWSWFWVPLQIVVVDLLLGADNALVIALACRGLPRRERLAAATAGVAGAVVIRTLLTFVSTALLAAPFVKLIAAAMLLVIALNLVADAPDERGHPAPSRGRFWSTAAIILVADAAMSLDNVVALAAIARGNWLWLATGVAVSVPIIAFGGAMLSEFFGRSRGLVDIGAALLGWIALQMAVNDAAFGGGVENYTPGLAAFAPALGAGFVFAYARLRPGSRSR